MYATKKDADDMIRKMQNDPTCYNSRRLRSYYNRELGGHFVGNSKYDD